MISFADNANHRLVRMNVSGTGGTAQSGGGEGAFYYPSGMDIDSASGALYVQDGYGRVQMLNSSTTEPVGWTGYVSTNPTGGYTGCTTAAGTLTPGLCRGGTSGSNAFTEVGFATNSEYLKFDSVSGYLYQVDTGNNRVQRLQGF